MWSSPLPGRTTAHALAHSRAGNPPGTEATRAGSSIDDIVSRLAQAASPGYSAAFPDAELVIFAATGITS